MPEQIEVEAVKDFKNWESSDGQRKLIFYTLDIKKADGQSEEIDHARLQGGAEPQPGEKLEVIFEPGRFRRKMKKAPKEGGFKSGGARSPQVQAEITRQHSQNMALQLLALRGEFDGSPDEFLLLPSKLIKPFADWFDADVRAAGAAATGQQASQGVSGAPATPSAGVSESAAPSPSAQDSDKPSLKQLEFLEKLAKENGIQHPELGTFMEWANQTLTPGREGTCSEAIEELRQGGIGGESAAKTLRKRSQDWSGQQLNLPAAAIEGLELADRVLQREQGKIDSDIPF